MIPVNEPYIGKEELVNVIDCLESGWISSKGSYVTEFEDRFSTYCGVRHGISTTSGTTALHLAVAALGIGKGDEVIMPALTMIATAYAVVYSGAKPVLVDSEEETWNVDPSRIEGKITDQTKAIMPVHLYGHPADMDPILALAGKYNLYVIEDAAEAHGAEYKDRKAGGLSDIGCFSFYANKIITTGEGGMLVTDNDEIADQARRLRDLAHSRERRFLHTEVGFNYRLTNLQAAIGVAQLKRIRQSIEKKRWMASLYDELLSSVEGIKLPMEQRWARSVYWMYAILIEDSFGMSRDEFMRELKDRGIETRTFFIPMHQQPVFRKMGLFANESYPIAEKLSEKGLYLPSGLAITEEQIRYACEAIKEIACQVQRQ